MQLVNLAKTLNIPVIALVQLNREADNVDADDLSMRHIRDCGQIEQDASFVGLLGPTDYQTGHDESTIITGRTIGLKVVANRFGPGGDLINFQFHGSQLRFDEL